MAPFVTADPSLGALYQAPSRDQYGVKKLTPEEEGSMMARLAREGGGMIDVLGRALDTPAAIFRGALVGDIESGFSWDPDRRVSGEELLTQYGLMSKDANPWLKAGAGLAAEMALDPLSMVTGPMRSLTTAGKAAKAAGIIDKASDAALAKKGIDAASKSWTGAATRNWAIKNKLPETLETFSIRPLVGPRVAQTTTTLDELVRFADQGKKQKEAFEAVSNYLAKQGIRYDDVADDVLGGAFGLGYFTPLATFTPPGSQGLLDAFDRTGQALSWMYPTRKLSQIFDQRVNDTLDVADQVESLKHSRYLDAAKKEGRTLAARHAMTVSDIELPDQAKKILGADSLLSEQGNDFLTRVFENVPTKSDLLLKRSIGPAINKAVDSWSNIRRFQVAAARDLGMDVSQYRDMYKVLYSPRTAAEADFSEYGEGLSRSLFNTRMLEQKARQRYLQTPGGTVDLRAVSLLPKVDDLARKGRDSQYTIAEVGKEIRDYLNSKHKAGQPNARAVLPSKMYKITQEQGERIAQFMQRLDPRRPDGLPVFSEHPISAQARNIVSQSVARANARYIYDSMAEAAVAQARGQLSGGFKSASIAINDIAKATGLQMGDKGMAGPKAIRNLKEAIAKRVGRSASQINLDDYSIPETVYNRLTRIQSFYSSPRAQQGMWEAMDKFSSLFKGFVLAWPSRFVRDMYSNVFSIMLENNSVPDTLYGLSVAKKIINGNFDDALASIRELPQYASIADSEALRRKFIEDAAGSGILQTLASNDLITANRVGDIAQLVPGSTPLRGVDAIKELSGNWKNFFQIKDVRMPWQRQSAYETLNPVLNASQKMSDFVDSTGRLGGYISLLRQGVAPDMAAKRITEALVDYSSLTLMERQFFRSIFPWWAYNSRIGKYVVQHLAKNPGGSYAQSIRAMNTLQRGDENTYLPSAIRQSFAVRVPRSVYPYLGIDPASENDVAIRDIDFPGVDVLSLLAPQYTFAGTVSETLFNVLNQASPLVRAPIELATNMDFFSKRPLTEAVQPIDKIYMGLTGSPRPMNTVVRSVVSNIPGIQRPISFFGGLMDQRLPLPERLMSTGINTLSGVKQIHIDPEWKYNDARRENLNRLRGWTRTRTTNFVPKELIPHMPEQLLPNVAFDQSMQRRADQLNKEKERRRQQLMRGVK